MIVMLLLQALYLFAPAYFANMVPVGVAVLLRNHLRMPLDCYKKFRGRRITGDHKTWRGLISGILVGGIIFWLQQNLMSVDFFADLSLIDYSNTSLLIGMVMGFGALVGDAIKSVFKRQMDVPPGKNWFPFDQIDFIIGGLLALMIFYIPSLTIMVLIVLEAIVLHLLMGELTVNMKAKGNTKSF